MEIGWKPSVDQVSPACPRCGSSNTKFCYYNNYSLTQPRYFCKGCRRYWTKGGSLRNVPIGGGCRKSRRGKSSIRVSLGASSRPRLAHNGNDQPCSSFSSLGGPDDNNTNKTPSTSIDLAAVYANFLNQKPPQIQSGGPEMPDHGTHVVVPPVEFNSSFNQLGNSHFHQEISTGFLDCGPYSGGLSETPLLGDRSMMFFCGPDPFQKQRHHHLQQQHMIASGSNFSIPCGNLTSNVSLPPLPGLDIVAASEGLLTWPGEDLMLSSNQMLRETTTMSSSGPVVGPAEENSELLSGNMSTFGVLNLEAIFRS